MQVYQSFGLGSSYADVMRFDCLLRYSEYEVSGRDFPDVPSYLLGNIYQVPMSTVGWSSKREFDDMSEGRASSQVLSSMIICLFSRWEETFCWTKWERSSLVTAVKRRWTGRLWRTSFRPRTRQNTNRSCYRRRAWLWSGIHCRHHRGRRALWLAFMMSRLTLMTPWRDVTEAEVSSKDGCSPPVVSVMCDHHQKLFSN